jgi:hypothetical protein
VWQQSHGFRHSLASVGALLAALAVPLAARAEASPLADDAARPESVSETPPRIGMGATAAIGGVGIAALMAGFDVWYRPHPAYAFGLEGQTFGVDNGADPDYCADCLEGGQLVAAMGELRIPSTIPISGFVRAGLGAGFVKINHADVGAPDEHKVEPLLLLAAGPELTLSYVFLRARGTATVLASEAFLGYGAEIGAVF